MRRILLIFITIFYIGCGTTPSNEYKPYLFELFTTQYFWADKVSKHVAYYKYNSPQEMIDDLKYKPKDRWSMVITKKQNSDFLNQKSTGFGFAFKKIDNNFTIIYTRINSPADKVGIRRGDIILKLNHKKITINSLIRARREQGEKSSFLIYRPSIDKNITVNLMAEDYKFKVTKASIIDDNIGYLRLDSFTEEATEEIDSAFNFFKSKDIKNLVIDLRYNSGGSLITASILLDKLMRDMDNEVQFKIEWNSQNQNRNLTYSFETDRNSIDLDKIVFLTTRETASASELVINALRPYLEDNVAIIGDRTYGKPVGMEGKSYGRYIFYLINFVVKNSDGFYDYFDGLNVTKGCYVKDNDFLHQLGDIEEKLLKKALLYIDRGNC